MVTRPWTLSLGDGIAGLVGDRVFAWDRAWNGDAGGIAEYAADDGHWIRTRSIDGLHINGQPGFWEAVPGGYLASWDGPTFIRESGDQLAVAWVGAGDDWFDSHAVADGSLFIGLGRGAAAVVRIDLATGREQWRAPLVPWSQDVTVAVDRGVVYATWQEYDPSAPTPTVSIPRRVRAYALDTGRALWTHDFTAEPESLAVGGGIIAAATERDHLSLIDGATGRVLAHPPLAPLNGRVLVDDDQVIAIDAHDVVAFDLTTGAERWRAPATFEGRPLLLRHGDDVLVSTGAGHLIALDRTRGTARWDVGLGVEPYRAWTSASAVALDGGGAAGMSLPPSAPAETARIHGRVVASGCGAIHDAILTVDGRPIALGSDGAYAATVTARGLVRVQADLDPARGVAFDGRARAATALVRLDGRGDYAVDDLPVGVCGG